MSRSGTTPARTRDASARTFAIVCPFMSSVPRPIEVVALAAVAALGRERRLLPRREVSGRNDVRVVVKRERSLGGPALEARHENRALGVGAGDRHGNPLADEDPGEKLDRGAREPGRVRRVDAHVLHEELDGLGLHRRVGLEVRPAHRHVRREPRQERRDRPQREGGENGRPAVQGDAAASGRPQAHALPDAARRRGASRAAASASAVRAEINAPIFTQRVSGRNRKAWRPGGTGRPANPNATCETRDRTAVERRLFGGFPQAVEHEEARSRAVDLDVEEEPRGPVGRGEDPARRGRRGNARQRRVDVRRVGGKAVLEKPREDRARVGGRDDARREPVRRKRVPDPHRDAGGSVRPLPRSLLTIAETPAPRTRRRASGGVSGTARDRSRVHSNASAESDRS